MWVQTPAAVGKRLIVLPTYLLMCQCFVDLQHIEPRGTMIVTGRIDGRTGDDGFRIIGRLIRALGGSTCFRSSLSSNTF